MVIRKFTPKDAAKLSKLMQNTVLTSNSADYSKTAIRFLYNKYLPANLIKSSKTTDIFVLHHHGKLLGTVSLISNRVSKMFVSSKYQKAGIGSKLLKHVERLAKKRNAKTLKVRSSVTAVGFYEKLGFKKVRKTSDKLIGPVIWMRKDL